MWLTYLEVALVGAIVCLDRVFLQAMISRPIVIGPVVGLLLSAPLTGLTVGAFIEMLWIDRIPMGAYVPPNDSVASVLATAGAVIAGRTLGSLSHELVALSILVFIPCAIIARNMDIWIIKTNEGLSKKALKHARAGDIKGIAREHRYGILKAFSGTFIIIFVCLVPGVMILEWVFPLLSYRLLKALGYTYSFIPVLGIAVALNTIKLRGAVPVFAGVFLAVALIMGII